MKKLALLMLVVVCCFASCNTGRTPVREPIEYEGESLYKSISSGSMLFATSVKALADNSDLIVQAEFVTDLGVFNTSEMLREYGYINVGFNTICTFYEVRVTEVIKGDVLKGDTIVMRVMGGQYNDTLYTDDYSEKLTGDFEYILFLKKSIFAEMPYELTNPAQAYLPLKERALSLNTKIDGWSLFKNGQSASSIISTIKRNMSSAKELENKQVANDLIVARNSISWQESSYNGTTIYEDGYTGELIKYSSVADMTLRVETYLQSITLTKKLDSAPSDQIYHVGFYASGAQDLYPRDLIYKTISLSDTAVLCNGSWYAYKGDLWGMKISNIYKTYASD
ncbi:MAG: hypothetical protein FWF18_06080 [Dehalococcoidia bacterium]|nr:hypothetical protein [Dehalococcoidia bacterium]